MPTLGLSFSVKVEHHSVASAPNPMFSARMQTVCLPWLIASVLAKPWFGPTPGYWVAMSGRDPLARKRVVVWSTVTSIVSGAVGASRSKAQPETFMWPCPAVRCSALPTGP